MHCKINKIRASKKSFQAQYDLSSLELINVLSNEYHMFAI